MDAGAAGDHHPRAAPARPRRRPGGQYHRARARSHAPGEQPSGEEPVSRAAHFAPLALALAGFLAPAAARGAAPPEDSIGTYVVRPGDTLEEITRRFLGTA